MKAILAFFMLSWFQIANANSCADVSYFVVDSIDTLQGSYIYTFDVRDCKNLILRTFTSKFYGSEEVIAHSKQAKLASTKRIAINGEWVDDGRPDLNEGWILKTKYSWNEDKSALNIESYQFVTYESSGYEGITEITRRRTREGDNIVDRILAKKKERWRGDEEWLHGTQESKDKNEKLKNFSHPVLDK